MLSTNCTECNGYLTQEVLGYSPRNFRLFLCYGHQQLVKELINHTTPETRDLNISLKLRGVSPQIEIFDGYNTIDFALIQAKVNIDVDGMHHNFNAVQAFSD